ncbi:MAG: hypothetical protein QXT84_05845 [Candidatus Bathyarchaeia archaeon]
MNEMGKVRALLPLMVLLLIMPILTVSSQPTPGGSFESAGEVHLDVGKTVLFNSTLSQLEDHYYKLSGVGAGYELVLNITMHSKEGGMTMVSLFTEKKAKVFDDKFVLRSGELRTISLRWLTEKGGDFYLKISAVGGIYEYNVSATLLDRRDAGKKEAGSSIEEATYVGLASYGAELSFSGYLAQSGAGDDFVDFYVFDTMLRNMEAVRINVLPSADMSLEASLHLPDGFTVARNSSTSPGKGFTLTLKGDIAGNKSFYLKVSNFDGHGGGGRYSININVFNLTATTEEPKVPINLVDRELARQLIIISVGVIAGMTVVALVLRRRTTSAEGWYGEYGY